MVAQRTALYASVLAAFVELLACKNSDECVLRGRPDPSGGYPVDALPSGPCNGSASCQVPVDRTTVDPRCQPAIDDWQCDCADGRWSCALHIPAATTCLSPRFDGGSDATSTVDSSADVTGE